ncbi:MAG: hypothetical protein QXT13_13175, partial [Pyrobaculum sp.]
RDETMTAAYDVLRELKCATAREVATRLGVAHATARTYLERLATRGLAVKKKIGRVALYCIAKEDVEPSGVYKSNMETRMRLSRVEKLLAQYGCVSVTVLARELRISHSQTSHLMRVMLLMGRGVKMVVGKTAVLCRDRKAAEDTIARLRETVHRLAVENMIKYATPSKILQIIKNDKEAYSLFSKFIKLSRIDESFSATALAFADAILKSLYGEPALRQQRRLIYVVTQPRPEHGIEITDSVDGYRLYVNLPDGLAEVLRGADADQVILRALEQMLQKFRT